MTTHTASSRFSPLSTSELWERAHQALTLGRWSTAVDYLEKLMYRGDSPDLLSDATAYRAPEHLVQFLQDRIDACNRNAR